MCEFSDDEVTIMGEFAHNLIYGHGQPLSVKQLSVSWNASDLPAFTVALNSLVQKGMIIWFDEGYVLTDIGREVAIRM